MTNVCTIIGSNIRVKFSLKLMECVGGCLLEKIYCQVFFSGKEISKKKKKGKEKI